VIVQKLKMSHENASDNWTTVSKSKSKSKWGKSNPKSKGGKSASKSNYNPKPFVQKKHTNIDFLTKRSIDDGVKNGYDAMTIFKSAKAAVAAKGKSVAPQRILVAVFSRLGSYCDIERMTQLLGELKTRTGEYDSKGNTPYHNIFFPRGNVTIEQVKNTIKLVMDSAIGNSILDKNEKDETPIDALAHSGFTEDEKNELYATLTLMSPALAKSVFNAATNRIVEENINLMAEMAWAVMCAPEACAENIIQKVCTLKKIPCVNKSHVDIHRSIEYACTALSYIGNKIKDQYGLTQFFSSNVSKVDECRQRFLTSLYTQLGDNFERIQAELDSGKMEEEYYTETASLTGNAYGELYLNGIDMSKKFTELIESEVEMQNVMALRAIGQIFYDSTGKFVHREMTSELLSTIGTFMHNVVTKNGYTLPSKFRFECEDMMKDIVPNFVASKPEPKQPEPVVVEKPKEINWSAKYSQLVSSLVNASEADVQSLIDDVSYSIEKNLEVDADSFEKGFDGFIYSLCEQSSRNTVFKIVVGALNELFPSKLSKDVVVNLVERFEGPVPDDFSYMTISDVKIDCPLAGNVVAKLKVELGMTVPVAATEDAEDTEDEVAATEDIEDEVAATEDIEDEVAATEDTEDEVAATEDTEDEVVGNYVAPPPMQAYYPHANMVFFVTPQGYFFQDLTTGNFYPAVLNNWGMWQIAPPVQQYSAPAQVQMQQMQPVPSEDVAELVEVVVDSEKVDEKPAGKKKRKRGGRRGRKNKN